MKVAVIGGGSTYTPELMEGLAQWEMEGGPNQVALFDIDEQRQKPVAAFSQRMVAAMGSKLKITVAPSFDDAIEHADFVLFQIRVGGQKARHDDILMGTSRGIIGQETTGAGGFAKALRTIPIILEMASKIRTRNPDAWIINFTNPSGIVTEAICRHANPRCVGLCNVPKEFHMEVAAHLKVPAEAIDIDWVGLNHLGWCRRVLHQGQDLLPAIIEAVDQIGGPKNIPDLDYPQGMLAALKMIPSSYVRYFYMTEMMLTEIMKKPKTRAQEVMELEEQLLAYYRVESNSAKPQLLNERGGAWYSRVAVEVMSSLKKTQPSKVVVNCLNNGAIDGLPPDACVEVPAWLSDNGVSPIPVGAVEEQIFGLIRQVKAYERLTIEAAMERSREKALLALMANPLVASAEKARWVVAALEQRGIL